MTAILIIDDDPMILEINQEVFLQRGFAVDTANNGQEGLERVAGKVYDLILTDLMMPVMGGLDFLCTIRDQGIDIPVMVVTGHPKEDAGALRTLANAVFEKPYTPEELYYAANLLLPKKA